MDKNHSPDSFYEKIIEVAIECPKNDKKVVKPEFKEEEVKILDLVIKDSNPKIRKKAGYALNEEKALLKMKNNVGRGNVRVEDTPKGGAKLVYLNPGDFKEVMDVLSNLKVNQKFTIGKVNISVMESYIMDKKRLKKIQYKIVLRPNKRTFPTATTSPTFHMYPTDQKLDGVGPVDNRPSTD